MSSVSHIESAFVDHSDIIDAFGKNKIEERYEALLEEADIFIDKMDYRDSIVADRLLFLYVVLDYFSDILRLKRFHKIDLIEEEKIIAYEIYWILRRMPFQRIKNNSAKVFVNEQFAVSRIMQCLCQAIRDEKMLIPNFDNLKFFTETLFYSLKFRPIDARSIELIILSFKAGLICSKEKLS